MKKWTPILLIAVFATITLFGYLAMAHESHEGGCMAATMAQAVCPSESGGLASINFHIDSLKTFSTAISEIGSLPGFLAIALGLALLLIAKFFWEFTQNARAIVTPHYRTLQRLDHVTATSQILHWILRLNNSPSVA